MSCSDSFTVLVGRVPSLRAPLQKCGCGILALCSNSIAHRYRHQHLLRMQYWMGHDMAAYRALLINLQGGTCVAG